MRGSGARNPGSFHFVPFDLAEIEGIAGLVKTLRKEFGPIYGLVNNAGMSFEGALALMPNSQIEQLVRVNTLSPMVLTKYVVRCHDGRWRRADRQHRFDCRLHRLQRPFRLRRDQSVADRLYPIAGARSGAHGGERECRRARLRRYRNDAGARRTSSGEQIVRRSALRRLADVDDVADAVEFLLSDKAKNITGTVLTVDAGSTA